jgi:hypothetical protein
LQQLTNVNRLEENLVLSGLNGDLRTTDIMFWSWIKRFRDPNFWSQSDIGNIIQSLKGFRNDKCSVGIKEFKKVKSLKNRFNFRKYLSLN